MTTEKKSQLSWAKSYFEKPSRSKTSKKIPPLYIDGMLQLMLVQQSDLGIDKELLYPIEALRILKDHNVNFFETFSKSKKQNFKLLLIIPSTKGEIDDQLFLDFIKKHKKLFSKYTSIFLCHSDESEISRLAIKKTLSICKYIAKNLDLIPELLDLSDLRRENDLSDYDFTTTYLNLYKRFGLLEQTLLSQNAKPISFHQKLKKINSKKIFISESNYLEVFKVKSNFTNKPFIKFDLKNTDWNFDVFAKFIYNLVND